MYKIEHHIVTGKNNASYAMGSIVDESVFTNGTIQHLLDCGAISKIEVKKVKINVESNN